MKRLFHLFVSMRPRTSSWVQLTCQYLYIVFLFAFMILSSRCSADVQFYICYTSTNYTAGSHYQTYLNQVLTALPAVTPPTGFNKTVAGLYPDQVYGVALCRVDVCTRDCKTCVSSDSVSLCPGSKEVRIWYDNCYMHYSDKAFFGSIHNSGWYSWSYTNVTDPEVFNTYRHSLMANLSAAAVSDASGLLFAMGYTNYASFKTIYGMVQCTRDVSAADCGSCLADVVDSLPLQCGPAINCRSMDGTCGVRYDITAFFVPPPPPPQPQPPTPQPPPPVDQPDDRKHKQLVIIIFITVSIASLISLCACLSYAFIVRSTSRGASTPIGEENLQVLSFDAIRVATDNFSMENKLGEGGYGPVYKIIVLYLSIICQHNNILSYHLVIGAFLSLLP